MKVPGPAPEVSAGEAAHQDGSARLDSWKEIAAFFRREVRTVQLWERHEQLPIHRHHHRKAGTVHAYEAELRAWWEHRSTAARAPQPIVQTAAAAHITLAVIPFSDPGNILTEGDRSELSRRIADALDVSIPSRLRVACSLSVAQRHAGGALAEEHLTSQAEYQVQGLLGGGRQATSLRLCLIRNRDQRSVWERTYTFAVGELQQRAGAMAATIARALAHHLLISRHSVRGGSVKPAARYAYLRGRYLWSRRSTVASIFSALDQFRQATEIDPTHASAFAGVADCWAVLGWLGAVPRETALLQARRAALAALSLDSSLAEGHIAMGGILGDFDWNWESAEEEILIGIDLNPSYAQAYCWYGKVLQAQGRTQEAIAATELAQDLDPTSAPIGMHLGRAYFYAGQPEKAIELFQHVLRMQPDHFVAHGRLGLAFIQMDQVRPGLAHLQYAFDASSGDLSTTAMLAYAHARAGERDQANALLSQLDSSEQRQILPAVDVAAAFVALGDHDRAMQHLSSGFAQRSVALASICCDPRLAPLRQDERFTHLRRQMRLG